VLVTSTGGASHLFTGNGEWLFTFSDPAGNTGSALASVSGIDKEAPKATNVTYAPPLGTPTSGQVFVTLTTNELITKPDNWSGLAEGTTFTRYYANNTTETVFFYDLVGNQGYTGIVIS
jgi:hypothetical protein